jgi:hypothetical protein
MRSLYQVVADIAAVNTLVTALNAGAELLAHKGAVNGYAGLDGGGKVPLAQLPSIAISDTFPVASQAAMLALTAERGDIAIRSDTNTSFILAAEPAATLANWKQLLFPLAVSSFNGRTGAIGLLTADVTAAMGFTPVNKAGDTMTGRLITTEGNSGYYGIDVRPTNAAYGILVDLATASQGEMMRLLCAGVEYVRFAGPVGGYPVATFTTGVNAQYGMKLFNTGGAAYGLYIETGSSSGEPLLLLVSGSGQKFMVQTNGLIALGHGVPVLSGAGKVHMAGDCFRVQDARSPASNATGNAGEICWDANYVYVCTATNTWKRAALAGGY